MGTQTASQISTRIAALWTAYDGILTGRLKSYTIAGRTFSRVTLAELRAEISEMDKEYTRLTRTTSGRAVVVQFGD